MRDSRLRVDGNSEKGNKEGDSKDEESLQQNQQLDQISITTHTHTSTQYIYMGWGKESVDSIAWE